MYRSWPAGVQELLRATFPGVIRQIRRNFFNLVSGLEPEMLRKGGDVAGGIESFVILT